MYDAFISYGHAVDGKLAPALQHALHIFLKPWYSRVAVRLGAIPALKVFRDQSSLSANPALWPSIDLKAKKYLATGRD
jgi:hypothetical protein